MWSMMPPYHSHKACGQLLPTITSLLQTEPSSSVPSADIRSVSCIPILASDLSSVFLYSIFRVSQSGEIKLHCFFLKFKSHLVESVVLDDDVSLEGWVDCAVCLLMSRLILW